MAENFLIIGAGIAGLNAALELSNKGTVTVIEKESVVGGKVRQLDKVFPNFECGYCILYPILEKIKSKNITIRTNTLVKEISKAEAGYTVNLSDGSTINATKIVFATGFELFDPKKIKEYNYENSDKIITSLEFEEKIREIAPKNIAFINCVGSRDTRYNLYCSQFCCSVSLKQAKMYKEKFPDATVSIYFMDIRANEKLYLEARDLGVTFIRGKPGKIVPEGDKIKVIAEDTILGEIITGLHDLVVLNLGIVIDPAVKSLAEKLNVFTNEDGFLETGHEHFNQILSQENVFVVGCAGGPRDIGEINSQVFSFHEFESDVKFDETKCSECPALCARACIYDAIKIRNNVKDKKHQVVHLEKKCFGCGNCVAVCPSGAFLFKDFDSATILEKVKNSDKKIISFTCRRGLLSAKNLDSEKTDVFQLPCTFLANNDLLLSTYLLGKKPVVIGCHGEERIKNLNKLLSTMGIEEINFEKISGTDITGFKNFIVKFEGGK
jgi:heterodisulfide reductase subunit A